MIAAKRLSREFYARPVLTAARELLGCIVVTARNGVTTSGRIVEVEAYGGPDDPASHAARLKRGLVAMQRPPGAAYVYRSYGIHAMLNVVAEPEGQPAAVLIRAIEPLDGCEAMRARRGVSEQVPTHRIASGPGNVARALGITLADDGTDLTESDSLAILPGRAPAHVMATARIGISRGLEHPWRFFDGESRSVSATKRGALPFVT